MKHELTITLSWRSFIRCAIALLIAFLVVELRGLAALLLAAALLACTLTPVLHWAVRRGWPRWSGVLLCAFIILAVVGGFIAVLVPTVTHQGAALIERLPAMRASLLQDVPASGGFRETADKIMGISFVSDPQTTLRRFLSWSAVALEGLVTFFVVLVLAIYFVAEGPQVYAWLAAFLPARHRPRAAQTAQEVNAIVRRWITGQLISSLLVTIFSFTALSILRVPSAAFLALMAGVFDIVPVIGFFCAAIPAVASALTVSETRGITVFGLYLLYHLFETYFIVPKVFGRELRLSMLAVLISCLAAGYLAGPLAIVFVLPAVACYPAIERIWLRPLLAPDTVEQHDRLATSEHPPGAA